MLQIILIILLLVQSCASDKLTEAGRAVKIEEKRSLSKNCEAVGRVSGTNKEGLVALAQNRMLNDAAKLGATAVTIDETITNGKEQTVLGTAYLCR